MSKSNFSKTDDDGTVTAAALDNPSTATFALHPNEVLKLVSASKLGEIYLILRPLNPTDDYLDSLAYTINSINSYNKKQDNNPDIQNLPPLPDNKTVIVESPKDENKIEIIQGDQIVQ